MRRPPALGRSSVALSGNLGLSRAPFVLRVTKLCPCALDIAWHNSPGCVNSQSRDHIHGTLREVQRRLTIVLSILLTICVAVYATDWLQFRIRGRDALGSVPLRVLYAVQQKNGKTEFLIRPPEIETCANSLFLHAGYSPCWYLRRHPERRIQI